MNWSGLFDSYGLTARLQPALVVLFPVLITIAVWSKPMYEAGSGLISLAAACGVLVYLGHTVRARGRAVEPTLFSSWGGPPATRWLLRGDNTLDAYTKARYVGYLERNILDWKAPTAEQEASDPDGARTRYETAVRWLRETTRDKSKYPLVFKENVAYGFRRNLYSAKALGVAAATCAVAINVVAMLPVSPRLPELELLPGSALLLLNVGAVASWLTVVKAEWVKDAADSYARALLACCERAQES